MGEGGELRVGGVRILDRVYLDYNIYTHDDALRFMSELGFKVNPNNKKINNISELMEYVNYWTIHRPELPYEIDGIVIKVDDLNDQELVKKAIDIIKEKLSVEV